MKCDGCIHELMDRTKEPCELCMASVLNGGERINYEAMPAKTWKCVVHFYDDYRCYEEITGYHFQGDWLIVQGEGFQDYWKTEDISHIEVKENDNQ